MVSKGKCGSLNLRSFDAKMAGLYDLEETLGRGHYAVVKRARHVFTGETVAVKVIDKTKLDDVSKTHIFQEVRCMKLVQHPNVVRLYEVIDTQTKLYLILELGDGGDLYDYIMKHEGGLTETMAKKYFVQILRAISYCHRLHIVHRDLKPENVVFFEKNGLVKLTDFGFSNKFSPGQKLATACGSLAYSAPEILLGEAYDAPAVDVWSLGVILYMLVCGTAPFHEANDSETLTMIMDCKYDVPETISEPCRKLICKMLVRRPEMRATLDEIARDSWLCDADSDTAPKTDDSYYLPLISRQQISEDDHQQIVQQMENGKIATKDEIVEALERNPYNHVTSTYYLLAERMLRQRRQDMLVKKRPPDLLLNLRTADESISSGSSVTKSSTDTVDSKVPRTGPASGLLQVPTTPNNDVFHRSVRKCSIVQEEEDEEVIELSRTGSKSETKLNLKLGLDNNNQTVFNSSSDDNGDDDEEGGGGGGGDGDDSNADRAVKADNLANKLSKQSSFSTSAITDDHKGWKMKARRDSHDDSSDSQDACGSGSTVVRNRLTNAAKLYVRRNSSGGGGGSGSGGDGGGGGNGKGKETKKVSASSSRSKRSNGFIAKTVRLVDNIVTATAAMKHSRSLNCIAEVQEETARKMLNGCCAEQGAIKGRLVNGSSDDDDDDDCDNDNDNVIDTDRRLSRGNDKKRYLHATRYEKKSGDGSRLSDNNLTADAGRLNDASGDSAIENSAKYLNGLTLEDGKGNFVQNRKLYEMAGLFKWSVRKKSVLSSCMTGGQRFELLRKWPKGVFVRKSKRVA